jgi:predicted DNA-binding protein
MAKKAGGKVTANRADQYMVRFSPGLRERLARRAAENGRSMNTEIVDAIEKHLEGADRMTRLWDFFEKHRENIEAIDRVWGAVEDLEHSMHKLTGDGMYGTLTEWRHSKDNDAREALRPVLTSDQVKELRALLEKAGVDEQAFLRESKAAKIEEVRDFERASKILQYWPRRDIP